MSKRILSLIAVLALSLGLTGCANINHQVEVMDLSKVEQDIKVGETTLAEARTKLDTPAFISTTTAEHKKVAGFIFLNNTTGRKVGNIFLKAGSFGLARSTLPQIAKFVYLTLDEHDVVSEVKLAGYSWMLLIGMTRSRMEALRELTDEELHSRLRYDDLTIYEKFYEQVAREKGVSVAELSKKEKRARFPVCNADCLIHRKAEELYGSFDEKTFKEIPDEQPGDMVSKAY